MSLHIHVQFTTTVLRYIQDTTHALDSQSKAEQHSVFIHLKNWSPSLCTAGAADALTFEEMAGAVCKQVYAETLRGTIMACQRYKDELLEACLELLLSAPTTVLSTQVSCSAMHPTAGAFLHLVVLQVKLTSPIHCCFHATCCVAFSHCHHCVYTQQQLKY